ncbi:hypothetical protein MP228_001127 [Amoeboaphelidium protococcarum]|nr:hypothetical protein MP228_001127 [Amoeboaphelidium protococcarum]
MMLYQLFYMPDVSLHKHLSPKDLLELSLSTKWLQSFVREEKKFTRDLYWHYYGPPLAAFRIKDHSYLNLHSRQDYMYFMHDSLRTLYLDNDSYQQNQYFGNRVETVEVADAEWREVIKEFNRGQVRSAYANGRLNSFVGSRNAQDEVCWLLKSFLSTAKQNNGVVNIAALQDDVRLVELTPCRCDALADRGHLHLVQSLVDAKISVMPENALKLEDLFGFQMSFKGRKLFIDYLWIECQGMSWSKFNGCTQYLQSINQLPDQIYRRLIVRYLKLNFNNFYNWKFAEVLSSCDSSESDGADVQMNKEKKYIIQERKCVDSGFMNLFSIVDYVEIQGFLKIAARSVSSFEGLQIIIAILDYYGELQNVDNVYFQVMKGGLNTDKLYGVSLVGPFCLYAVYNLPHDYCLLNEIVNSSILTRKNSICIMSQFQDSKCYSQVVDFMLRQIGVLTMEEQEYALLNALSFISRKYDDSFVYLQKLLQDSRTQLHNSVALNVKEYTELLVSMYGKITYMIEKLGGFDLVHSCFNSLQLESIQSLSAHLISRLLADLSGKEAYLDVEEIAAKAARLFINKDYSSLGSLLSSYLNDGVPFALSVAAVKEHSSNEQLQILCQKMTVEVCTQLGFEQEHYDPFAHQLLAAINGFDKSKLSEMARILKLVYDRNYNLNLSQDAHNACKQLLVQILNMNTSHSKVYKALPAKAYHDWMWHLLYLRVLIEMNKSPKKLKSEILNLWSVIGERVTGLKSNRGVIEIKRFKCALLEIISSLSDDSKVKKVLEEFQQVVESAQVAQSQRVEDIRAENKAKKARVQ